VSTAFGAAAGPRAGRHRANHILRIGRSRDGTTPPRRVPRISLWRSRGDHPSTTIPPHGASVTQLPPLKRSGVDVLTLAPGPTRTEGVETAEGIDFGKLPLPMAPPNKVVKKALNGLGRKPLIIPGRMNRISDFMGKYLTPRRMQTVMFGQLLGRATTTDGRTR
jgi:hypothetical protein